MRHQRDLSMANVRVQDILDFWFGEAGAKAWFKKDANFDARIKTQFEATVRRLKEDLDRDGASVWEDSAPGALALILCLDQFPRNMHRDSPRAFFYDGAARCAAKRALGRGYDRETLEERRAFFYMPFMHSEEIADQDLCVELACERLEGGQTAHHARRHRDVIRRFGRFPHRNKILGRPNTDEEEAFIGQGKFAP